MAATTRTHRTLAHHREVQYEDGDLSYFALATARWAHTRRTYAAFTWEADLAQATGPGLGEVQTQRLTGLSPALARTVARAWVTAAE